MTRKRIFLDAAMGCEPSGTDLKAFTEAAAFLGFNQVAKYSEASRAAAIVRAATEQIAAFLEVSPDSVLPIHNLASAIQTLLELPELKPGGFSISAVSRSSILQQGTTRGGAVVLVDETGSESGQSKTWHLTQAGNPETGNIPDLSKIAENSRLVIDATEWVGRMENLPAGEIILLRASSWGSFAPVCFLVKTTGSWNLSKFERQQIAPSPYLLVAAAQALRTQTEYSEIAAKHRLWLEEFESAVSKDSRIQFPATTRRQLPHLRTFSVANLDAEVLAFELDKMGFAVGAGSACGLESGSSQVLSAMGWKSATNIRIGLPLDAQQADLENLAELLPQAIKQCGN